MVAIKDVRKVAAGDNRLGMDVVVNAHPFLRGIKAARHFTSKKDESGTYSCVRICPNEDALIISAANPMTMFVTGAQMYEAAYNPAGVVDLPVWMVDQILAVFKPKGLDAQIRITTHMDSDKVRFSESTGLFELNVHQWPRQFMEEAAPDVPPIIDAVFALPAITDQPQLISPNVAHQVLQVAKIMGEDFLLDQEPNHYRWRIGAVARAISLVPSVLHPEEDEEERGVSVLEDEEDDEPEAKPGLRVVSAVPPQGQA